MSQHSAAVRIRRLRQIIKAGATHKTWGIGRAVYPVRILAGFFASTIMLLSRLEAGSFEPFHIISLVFWMSWSHISYLLYKYSNSNYRVELWSLIVDTFVVGTFINLIYFAVIPSLVIASMSTTGHITIRGWPQFFYGALAITIGILFAGLFNGFTFILNQTMQINIICSIAIIIYLGYFAHVVYYSSVKIKSAKHKIMVQKQEIEKQNNKLAAVNQELIDFAHVVSHDLKAPLRGINTLTKFLKEEYSDRLDKEGNKHLDMLTQRASAMHEMITGILSYSQKGQFEGNQTEVNLNTLLPEIVDMIVPTSLFSVDIDNDLPKVYAEKAHVTHIFQNLLSNAVKYMDKPEGLIKLGCINQDDYWKFNVTDNGPGIDEKDFDRIFSLFQTLDKNKKEDSTGIGLALVKKIVSNYHGKIWVESELGKGSTFIFLFPRIM